jgi:hypothetical protein
MSCEAKAATKAIESNRRAHVAPGQLARDRQMPLQGLAEG